MRLLGGYAILYIYPGTGASLFLQSCYKNPKQEKVSHAFKHLMQNLKVYNGVGV